MLNPGYTTIERVVENVIRDTGFTEDINFADIVEWVFVAQELIGVQSAYIQKVTDGNTEWNHFPPVQVVNYRAELPCDFHSLISVREYCNKMPMIGDSGTFLKSTNDPNIDHYSNITYTINDNYIFTNIEEGYLEISYWAFPTDENGMPMIPDDVRYLKAVEAYIAHKLSTKLWLQDKLSTEKKNFLETEWLWYVKSAKSKADLPSYDKAEALKNQILRLIQRPTQHLWSFEALSNQEQAYTSRYKHLRRPTL